MKIFNLKGNYYQKRFDGFEVHCSEEIHEVNLKENQSINDRFEDELPEMKREIEELYPGMGYAEDMDAAIENQGKVKDDTIERWLTREVENTLDRVDKKTLPEILRLNSQITGNNSLLVLNAHGGSRKKDWAYRDIKREKMKPAQEWIDAYSSKHNVVLFLCCNQKDLDVHSNKSILIYPNETIRVPSNILNKSRTNGWTECSFKYFIPRIGTVSDYELEYGLKKFKELH